MSKYKRKEFPLDLTPKQQYKPNGQPKEQLTTDKIQELRKQGYWVPLPGPQQLAAALSKDKRYREILFGGARGGGKTDLSIAIIGDRIRDPRAKQLVIRRNSGDLSDFEDRASQAFRGYGIKLRRNPMVLSGGQKTGRVLGGHLGDDDAYTKYQGHEYCRINIEELTQIPNQDRYEKLISSARSKYSDLFPQIFCTANPGGIGMAWVKRRFVAPDPKFNIVLKHQYHYVDLKGKKKTVHWQTVIDRLTGIWRAYVPATIDDNPILTESDPGYIQMLESLQATNPDLYEAWRNGSWDIQFGAVFEEFREYKHVFTKFKDFGISQDYFNGSFRIAGMDWGYNDMAVILWAMFDNITEKQERSFIYREAADNKKPPTWWAKKFAEIQERDPVDVLALPHDAFSHLGGNDPIADVFKRELEKLPVDKRPRIVKADKLNKDIKQAAVNATHDMLQDSEDGKPFLQIHHSCKYLIETLPTIVYAKDTGGEKLDDNNEDHALDAMFYTLQTASRVRGKLLGKSQLLPAAKQGFTKGDTYAQLGIDMAKAIKSQGRSRDWRTL